MPPKTLAKSIVKHESHRLHLSACSPDISVISSTVEQKQVGQTSVQLAHVRQRLATSFQYGLSRLAKRSFFISFVSSDLPMFCAVVCTSLSAVSISDWRAVLHGISSINLVPFSLPGSAIKKCPSSFITSVKAISKPPFAFGPVFIETQKQVPPACVQFTATIKTFSRRVLYTVSVYCPLLKTLSCILIALSSQGRTPIKA